METLFRIFYWIRIASSPIVLFGVIAFITYLELVPPFNLIIASAIAIIGIVLGVLLAEHARKKYGTIEFSSRVISSPDFDKMAKEGEKK